MVRGQPPAHRSGLRSTRLIAVASGKGGVGKSNIALNYALALQRSGQRVALLDGDTGFANLDILLGLRPHHSLQDVLEGRVALREALIPAPFGLSVVSGGSGALLDQSGATEQMARFATELATLDGLYDRVFIDFGAGFDRSEANLMSLCDELLLVSTPEPTALADAYALIKMIAQEGGVPALQLVINRTRSVADGAEAARKLTVAADKFLRVRTHLLGYVLEDSAVARAVSAQTPFLLAEPHSLAARCVEQLAKNTFLRRDAEPEAVRPRGLRAFLERFAFRR